MARPKKPIDVEQLKKLAAQQWTDGMLAAFFDIHQTNIRKRFAKEIDAGRQQGQAKLVTTLMIRSTGADNKPLSERLLEHALNRFVGPVKTIVQHEDVTIKDKADALLKLQEAMDRLKTEIAEEEAQS